MATGIMTPFTALRPAAGRAQDVAARPYDVVSFAEAQAQATDRPFSFLHVSRAEIDVPPGTDPHTPEVYARAAAALHRMCRDGVLIEETSPSYYIYRITTADHEQTGVAAAGSITAYQANIIRRHELTRPDKESDRVRQIEAVGAQTGPVLAAHPVDAALDALLSATTTAAPIADAETIDGARHRVWRIDDAPTLSRIKERFDAMEAIYIADGHHRSAAAARVAEARGGGSVRAEDDRFLVVSFPVDQLRILDYNRVVRDLNGLTADAFLARVNKVCEIAPAEEAVRPATPQRFGLFVDGRWYALKLRTPPPADASPVDRLDVSLLQQTILAPILGIGDPRTDPRIDFIGGGRGLGALETAVRDGGYATAFSLYPTRFDDIVAVADAALIMPPKSTWFEPKLADGLLSLPLVRR